MRTRTWATAAFLVTMIALGVALLAPAPATAGIYGEPERRFHLYDGVLTTHSNQTAKQYEVCPRARLADKRLQSCVYFKEVFSPATSNIPPNGSHLGITGSRKVAKPVAEGRKIAERIFSSRTGKPENKASTSPWECQRAPR